MTLDDIYTDWFNRIDNDLSYLLTCFQEVLVELGEDYLANLLPVDSGEARALAATVVPTEGPIDRALQVHSIVFQLLNLVEENAAIQARRFRVAKLGHLDEPGLWSFYLRQFRDAGIPEEEIVAHLREVMVEVVLTAHPTEAKRPVVLRQHRALFEELVKRENPIWTKREQRLLRERIKTQLERLWRTGEMYLYKPDVYSELENMLDYFRQVFPRVLPIIDERLREAWKECGFTPALLENASALPKLRFGNWVGGDRDGHPFVTAEVTHKTLNRLRDNALDLLAELLDNLFEKLSLLDLLQRAPTMLDEAIEVAMVQVGEGADEMCAASPNEPWRQFINLIEARLPQQSCTAAVPYETPAALRADLVVLRESLKEIGAHRLVEEDVNPVLRSLDVFGFHTATLDIRQNSDFHEQALIQLLEAAGMAEAEHYADWDEEARRAFLTRELESPRPLAPTGMQLGDEAEAAVETLYVLSMYREQYGTAGLGAYIVSMTRDLSDLLVVYVLAREAGLVHPVGDGMACDIAVVPLFETVDDLQNSPRIMDGFLAHPVTCNSLKLQGERPIQQVMMGYSDSNKDAGILASQWYVHCAQENLAATAKNHGVEILFFHGRGGTSSRGAGPTHRFMEALPHASLMGAFRLTEQGESISQKYGNPATAVYNLEMLIAGVTAYKLYHNRAQVQKSAIETLGEMLAKYSSDAYKALLEADGFLEFWAQATPIDALEHSFIGSRPARRTGKRTLADLRAIPWVFSWSQARYYLPGWYGIGSALERLEQAEPESFARLQKEIYDWPFLRYVLNNAETSQASADLDLMWAYAQLVEDVKVRKRIYDIIALEWDRTENMINKVFGKPRAERRPRMMKTLQMRDQGLRALHENQIELLKQWRSAQASEDTEQISRLLPSVLLAINAVSSGLRTTG